MNYDNWKLQSPYNNEVEVIDVQECIICEYQIEVSEMIYSKSSEVYICNCCANSMTNEDFLNELDVNNIEEFKL